ncbi:MAG TPA: D-aminoacyl-tRNA deacylase [Anseongella sp.]
MGLTTGHNESSKIQTGEFGAYMKVNLVNDGPVAIFIDTKKCQR